MGSALFRGTYASAGPIRRVQACPHDLFGIVGVGVGDSDELYVGQCRVQLVAECRVAVAQAVQVGGALVDLAAAAAVWGAGVPIYALDIAPELYS